MGFPPGYTDVTSLSDVTRHQLIGALAQALSVASCVAACACRCITTMLRYQATASAFPLSHSCLHRWLASPLRQMSPLQSRLWSSCGCEFQGRKRRSFGAASANLLCVALCTDDETMMMMTMSLMVSLDCWKR